MRKYSNIKWTKKGLRLVEKAVGIWETRTKNGGALDNKLCPLCQAYRYCNGCPIDQVGESCFHSGTYFKDWAQADIYSPSELIACRKMTAFLKRLATNGRKVLGVEK